MTDHDSDSKPAAAESASALSFAAPTGFWQIVLYSDSRGFLVLLGLRLPVPVRKWLVSLQVSRARQYVCRKLSLPRKWVRRPDLQRSQPRSASEGILFSRSIRPTDYCRGHTLPRKQRLYSL